MNKVWRSPARRAVVLVTVFLGLVMALGCGGDDPTHQDFCWMSIDTLYASGVSVHDTSDVRAAFEAYVAFVDTTAAEFVSERDWTYLTSRPFHAWHDRFYWQVDHEAYSPELDTRLTRRLVYVDEKGAVVWPFGCI